MIIHKIKKFLPPFIQNKLNINYSFELYPDYKTALADGDGYEDENLVKVIIAKTLNLKDRLKKNPTLDAPSLRIFVAIANSIKDNQLTVLDFGGSAGAHYFIVKSILGEDINLDWRVVETPKMVEEAVKNKLENKELTFYDNLASATNEKKIDLAVAIGSVHYTENPYDILKEIVKKNPSYLFLTRTPLAKKELILLQETSYSKNGIGKIPEEMNIKDKKIKYPVTILNREKVENIINNYGNILLKIDEDKAAYKTKSESFDLFGYLVKNFRL